MVATLHVRRDLYNIQEFLRLSEEAQGLLINTFKKLYGRYLKIASYIQVLLSDAITLRKQLILSCNNEHHKTYLITSTYVTILHVELYSDLRKYVTALRAKLSAK